MKKILSGISVVLVLSLLGGVRTASAFERNPKKMPPSYGGHSTREDSRESRKDHDRRKVHFEARKHYAHSLPSGYRALRGSNRVLYYLNGIFYQPTPYGYERVTAPAGIALPFGAYPVIYGGTTYYVSNGTYFVRGPVGYRVVIPPQRVLFSECARW